MRNLEAPAFLARVGRIGAPAIDQPAPKPARTLPKWAKLAGGVLLPSLVGVVIGVGGGDLLIKRNVAESDQQKAELRQAVQQADDEVRSVIGTIDTLVSARHTAALRMNQLIAAGNISGAVAYNSEYTATVTAWNDKQVALALLIQRISQCDKPEAAFASFSEDLRAARVYTRAQRRLGNVAHKTPLRDSFCPDAALFSSRQATDVQIFAGDASAPFGSVFEVFRFMHVHFRNSLSPETLLCVRSAESLFQAHFASCGGKLGWLPISWSTANCVAAVIQNDSPNRLCQTPAFGSSAAIGPARFETLGFWWKQAKSALLAYRIPYLKKVCRENLAFWTERFGPSCDYPEAIISPSS